MLQTLTPTEERVYALYMDEPFLKIREMAKALNRSQGTIKCTLRSCFIKGRARRSIGAATGRKPSDTSRLNWLLRNSALVSHSIWKYRTIPIWTREDIDKLMGEDKK